MNKILFLPFFAFALLVLVGSQDAFAYSGPISNSVDCGNAGGVFSGSTCTISSATSIPVGSTWDVKPGTTLQISTTLNVVGKLNIESNAFLEVIGTTSGSGVAVLGNSGEGILTNRGDITVRGGGSGAGIINVNNGGQLININKMTFFGGTGTAAGTLTNFASGRVTNDCNGVIIFNGNIANSGFFSNSGLTTNKGHMEFNAGPSTPPAGQGAGRLQNGGSVFNQNPGGIDFLAAVNPTAGIDFNPNGALQAGTLVGSAIIAQPNTCPAVPVNDEQVIGGKIMPIEMTSLLLANAQSFSWMIPVLLSGIGIGLFVVSRRKNDLQ